MKSLHLIKTQYALGKHFKSWEHFCSVANDAMFIKAVDEVAALYAADQITEITPNPEKIYVNSMVSKRNKRGRKQFNVRF